METKIDFVERRNKLVTDMANAAGIDETTARNYLEAEEWIYSDAIASLRADIKAGLFTSAPAAAKKADAEKARATATRELAAITGMKSHTQAVTRLLVALQLEFRDTGLRSPAAAAALDTLVASVSAHEFELSNRFDDLLFSLTSGE